MKFIIKHDITGRLRVQVKQQHMTFEQADILQYYLERQEGIICAKVHERTCNIIISYRCDKTSVMKALRQFQYTKANVPAEYLDNSGRKMNAYYQEKLVQKVLCRMSRRFLVPISIRRCFITLRAMCYIAKGIKTLHKGKIEVAVLDATAIGVSILRRDFRTAGSVMFLLGVGELLEEWTRKKSVDDLARSMSLNIEKAWLLRDGTEVLVDVGLIKEGDNVVVHMGNVIPFDGEVVAGEALVNQASLTGEGVPVEKKQGSFVYAGTVLEEGELTIQVKSENGLSRFEKIVTMIEESEKLKSGIEGKAEHLADKLVPYTLAGAIVTYFFTRNITKAVSVLMVDFSCALKLAIPISVLSAIREAGQSKITVKGGKYLEAIANADTIVFDKTGTLTKAEPTVTKVLSFNGEAPDELLRIAACMEEHFPHSMAKAVVDAAKKKQLEHEEMHSKVDYIVAHGISTTIEGKRAIIGSYHFVFEDEACLMTPELEQQLKEIPVKYSRLYLAIEQRLAAVICIEDPLREEAAEVVAQLKDTGVSKIVMMTGDSKHIARAIACEVGVDEYYAEVLPQDKAYFIEKEKEAGNIVMMIGDGINDSPALSASDVGIAIQDGAQVAREIADVTIAAQDLYELVIIKRLSNQLMKRIQKNYVNIVGINTMLILLGIAGILQPTTSALLHNTSTLLISLNSMSNLLDE